MKRNLILYVFLAGAFFLTGCAVQPDSSNIDKGSKTGLSLLESEVICREILSNKMWQLRKEGPFLSWKEANDYALELKLGGYEDWRLPSESELFELYYIHYWKKDINCVMNHTGEFWAVTKNEEPSLGHWEDYFLCGPEFKFVGSSKDYGFVRAIRP